MEILVAEDNPVNQMVAQGFLKHLGYDCDVVADGVEVISALERKVYDIVFMDIEMPQMGGVETTAKVRELYGPKPFIVAMSAHDESTVRSKLAQYQMDSYVTKPIMRDALTAAIQQFIQTGEGR